MPKGGKLSRNEGRVATGWVNGHGLNGAKIKEEYGGVQKIHSKNNYITRFAFASFTYLHTVIHAYKPTLT